MLRVALTGNIASGKSTVAEVWRRLGARVIDADVLARRVVEPGTPGLAAIVRGFGPEVLDALGRLDRAALRRMVFSDAGARRRLEAIVHPAVAEARVEEEAALARAGVPLAVEDIPLLFEIGAQEDFDVVVLVDAPEAVRLKRLVRERGLSEDEARRLIAAQMPAAAKRARADILIDNDGALDALEARAEEAWKQITGRPGASG